MESDTMQTGTRFLRCQASAISPLFILGMSLVSSGCSTSPGADSGADTGVIGDTSTTTDTPINRDDGGMDGSLPPDVIVSDTGTPDVGTSDAGVCIPASRFPVPTVTFTLPRPTSGTGLYYPNVQTSFPNVDWARLERLYIPAGTYSLINLGNLPTRNPAQPLVITNTGGQVHIDGQASAGYIFSMGGGSGWVLTGRYDPLGRTGDAGFTGHACGRYANSQDTYGIVSDGHFANGGHMGIGIVGSTRFEVEFVEIRRSGFAGLRINGTHNPDNTFTNLDDIIIHDTYVHDTKSEGYYIGWTGAPPSPLNSGIKIYNNRLLRTGTEALQVQNMGEGSEIHHNVVAWGAIDWRASFQDYQNSNSQTNIRRGTVRIHHNVFMGGANTLQSFSVANEMGDGNRTVRMDSNYFADTLFLAVYLGGTSAAGSTYSWESNFLRGLTFGYNEIYPTETDPAVVFRVGGQFTSPVALTNNRWEGTQRILAGLTTGNGTAGSVTATGNTNGTVEPFRFRDAGRPGQVSTRSLEMWTATATRHPQMVAVTYDPGDLVMYDGSLFECTVRNTNEPPPANLNHWRAVAFPADDVRTDPSSTYAAMGIGLQ